MSESLNDLYVTEVSRTRLGPSKRNRRHRHNFFEACLILKGRGLYDHGECSYPLKSGDLIVADPRVVHEITADSRSSLDLYFTQFAVTTEQADHGIIGAFLESHYLCVEGKRFLGPMFTAISQLKSEAAAAYRLHFHETLLQHLVLQIMAELTHERREEDPFQGVPAEVRNALDAIDKHLSEDWSVKQVAHYAKTSERTLRRRFRAHLGRSVVEEIRVRRVRRAAQLLTLHEMSISEIGLRVGLGDPAQFSRSFKSIVGVSPKQYRLDGARLTKKGNGFMKTEFE